MNDCPRQNPAYRPTLLDDELFSVLIVSWESRYHLKVLFNGIFWEDLVESLKILKS